MIKNKVSLVTLTLILCLMLPAIFLAPEANYTRAMNDIFANQADFVISREVAWSDDFDHGNITASGWSVQGFSPGLPPWTIMPANITAEDKTMRVHSPPSWSEAWRTSTVAYGSWAFDVYCVNTPVNRSYIAFVSGSPVLYPPDINTVPFEYGIITVVGQHIGYDSAFVLYRRSSVDPHVVPIGAYDVEEVSGWYHINITRDHYGNFEVYFNDTLGITATDTTHKTSDLFTFTAEGGYALDNIVVAREDDTYGPVIDSPILTPSTPNSTESVLVDVSVTDSSGVDTVILSYNDSTTWFNITMTGAEPDYEGTIPALPHGTEVQYRIYANDTIGNWAVSETDNYTVTDPTTPPPPPLPLDLIVIVGGATAVIIVLAIVFLRRR